MRTRLSSKFVWIAIAISFALILVDFSEACECANACDCECGSKCKKLECYRITVELNGFQLLREPSEVRGCRVDQNWKNSKVNERLTVFNVNSKSPWTTENLVVAYSQCRLPCLKRERSYWSIGDEDGNCTWSDRPIVFEWLENGGIVGTRPEICVNCSSELASKKGLENRTLCSWWQKLRASQQKRKKVEIPRQHLFGALDGMLAAVVVSVGVGVFELARWKTARSKRTGAGFGDSTIPSTAAKYKKFAARRKLNDGNESDPNSASRGDASSASEEDSSVH